MVHGDHKKYDTKHVVNTVIIEGTTTNMSGNFEVDLDNKYVNAILNLTAGEAGYEQIKSNLLDLINEYENFLKICRTHRRYG